VQHCFFIVLTPWANCFCSDPHKGQIIIKISMACQQANEKNCVSKLWKYSAQGVINSSASLTMQCETLFCIRYGCKAKTTYHRGSARQTCRFARAAADSPGGCVYVVGAVWNHCRRGSPSTPSHQLCSPDYIRMTTLTKTSTHTALLTDLTTS